MNLRSIGPPGMDLWLRKRQVYGGGIMLVWFTGPENALNNFANRSERQRNGCSFRRHRCLNQPCFRPFFSRSARCANVHFLDKLDLKGTFQHHCQPLYRDGTDSRTRITRHGCGVVRLASSKQMGDGVILSVGPHHFVLSRWLGHGT